MAYISATKSFFTFLSPQDDVAEADKFLQKWKTLSEVEKAKKKEEDEPLGKLHKKVLRSFFCEESFQNMCCCYDLAFICMYNNCSDET